MADQECDSLYTPLVVYFFVTIVGTVATVIYCCVKRYRGKNERFSSPIIASPSSPKSIRDDIMATHSPWHRDRDIESWQIEYKELKFGPVIGHGNVGEVYSGAWRGTKVAIKKLLGNWYKDEDMVERFREEILLLSSMRHPNVLMFIGAVMDPSAGNICLVTELCTRGNLYDFIHSSAPMSWRRRLSFAADVARGMNYLHGRAGVIQRDLKSANLLLDEYYQVKIADFGLSRHLAPGQMDTYCGTPATMAPEIVRRENYSEKADVFR